MTRGSVWLSQRCGIQNSTYLEEAESLREPLKQLVGGRSQLAALPPSESQRGSEKTRERSQRGLQRELRQVRTGHVINPHLTSARTPSHADPRDVKTGFKHLESQIKGKKKYKKKKMLFSAMCETKYRAHPNVAFSYDGEKTTKL